MFSIVLKFFWILMGFHLATSSQLCQLTGFWLPPWQSFNLFEDHVDRKGLCAIFCDFMQCSSEGIIVNNVMSLYGTVHHSSFSSNLTEFTSMTFCFTSPLLSSPLAPSGLFLLCQCFCSSPAWWWCPKVLSKSDAPKWPEKVESKNDVQKWCQKVISKSDVNKWCSKVMSKSDDQRDV